MDRDKLIELILEKLSMSEFMNMISINADEIADYLITNGIGDITAEKHRADMAEEALRLACKEINSESKVCGKVDCEFVTCHSDKCTYILTSHLKQRAAERLKEKQ